MLEFEASRNAANEIVVSWEGSADREYELQSAPNMITWQKAGIWTTSGSFSVTVALGAQGGGGAGGPDLPRSQFEISAYSNGNSLVSWIGADGKPYQVYDDLDFYDPVLDLSVLAPLYSYQASDQTSEPDKFIFPGSRSPNAADSNKVLLDRGESLLIFATGDIPARRLIRWTVQIQTRPLSRGMATSPFREPQRFEWWPNCRAVQSRPL